MTRITMIKLKHPIWVEGRLYLLMHLILLLYPSRYRKWSCALAMQATCGKMKLKTILVALHHVGHLWPNFSFTRWELKSDESKNPFSSWWSCTDKHYGVIFGLGTCWGTGLFWSSLRFIFGVQNTHSISKSPSKLNFPLTSSCKFQGT